MADDDLGPEGFGTRGIPSARRGYDKRVVDTLVSEAVERWVELKRRYDALRAEVDRAGGLEHLARDLKAVGDDVSRILEAAKEAADGMRVRAQSDADVVGTGAAADAAAVVQEAEDQAFQTRRDAWETGAELLALVRETASAILAEAEDDALLVRAEAERESHRRLAVTRKEQDDMIRSGRYELERQITNARDLAAEMLSVARTEEVSLVPTPDQEERRREVLGEIERLRASRGIEAINVLPAEPVPVRRSFEVLPGEVDSGLPDLSDALAAEVEQLGADRGGRRPDTAPRAAQSSRRSARSVPDDVGTLFEALRTTAEVDVLMGEGDSDPVSFHERVVVQAYNLGLRDLKRRIVDLQAVALEGLRTTGWSPEARAVTAELSPSFDQAVQRASAGGVEAARALGGVEAGQPAGSDRARRLIAMMAQELTSQLRSAAAGEAGPEETAAKMSRVFRTWRIDECERWVRAIVDAAYHDELLSALAGGGCDSVRGVSTGTPCAECPAANGAVWDPAGPPPEGTRLPPAHLGCTCTIAPVPTGRTMTAQ